MRQFILEKNPGKQGIIILRGKDFRYLRQVLRVKPGDMVSVRLPDGVLKNATVAKTDDSERTVTLQICADTFTESSEKSSVSLSPSQHSQITRGVQASEIEADTISASNNIEYWLFQFIPKPQKFEQIVRQATECGIKRIVPVIGEYSEKSSVIALQGHDEKPGAKKERIARIIKEARQQSGSPVETVVEDPVALGEAVELWKNSGMADAVQVGNDANLEDSVGVVLYERSEGCRPLSEILKERDGIKRICIVCGCEGGISPGEIDFLVKKGLFYLIHFSVNILRCETAALYGIAAVQSCASF